MAFGIKPTSGFYGRSRLNFSLLFLNRLFSLSRPVHENGGLVLLSPSNLTRRVYFLIPKRNLLIWSSFDRGLLPESSKPRLYSSGADFNSISSVRAKCKKWQARFTFSIPLSPCGDCGVIPPNPMNEDNFHNLILALTKWLVLVSSIR